MVVFFSFFFSPAGLVQPRRQIPLQVWRLSVTCWLHWGGGGYFFQMEGSDLAAEWKKNKQTLHLLFVSSALIKAWPMKKKEPAEGTELWCRPVQLHAAADGCSKS